VGPRRADCKEYEIRLAEADCASGTSGAMTEGDAFCNKDKLQNTVPAATAPQRWPALTGTSSSACSLITFFCCLQVNSHGRLQSTRSALSVALSADLTMPRRAAAPWTVVTQGTAVTYDDATLLDKLEYVLQAAPTPAAVTRTLAQDNFAIRVTVRRLPSRSSHGRTRALALGVHLCSAPCTAPNVSSLYALLFYPSTVPSRFPLNISVALASKDCADLCHLRTCLCRGPQPCVRAVHCCSRVCDCIGRFACRRARAGPDLCLTVPCTCRVGRS
jgi:hypothetical protein